MVKGPEFSKEDIQINGQQICEKMLSVCKLPSDLTNPFLEIHPELKSLHHRDGCAPVCSCQISEQLNCLLRGMGNQKEIGVAD